MLATEVFSCWAEIFNKKNHPGNSYCDFIQFNQLVFIKSLVCVWAGLKDNVTIHPVCPKLWDPELWTWGHNFTFFLNNKGRFEEFYIHLYIIINVCVSLQRDDPSVEALSVFIIIPSLRLFFNFKWSKQKLGKKITSENTANSFDMLQNEIIKTRTESRTPRNPFADTEADRSWHGSSS